MPARASGSGKDARPQAAGDLVFRLRPGVLPAESDKGNGKGDRHMLVVDPVSRMLGGTEVGVDRGKRNGVYGAKPFRFGERTWGGKDLDGPCATAPNPASASDACPTYSFRSPPRILIPKLCRSRDAWKAKAQLRGSQLKTLQVRVHDVCLSRDSWRQRAEAAQQQAHQLQDQVQQLQQQLASAQQQLSSLEQGKKTRRPAP
jgi:hypothetical protein